MPLQVMVHYRELWLTTRSVNVGRLFLRREISWKLCDSVLSQKYSRPVSSWDRQTQLPVGSDLYMWGSSAWVVEAVEAPHGDRVILNGPYVLLNTGWLGYQYQSTLSGKTISKEHQTRRILLTYQWSWVFFLVLVLTQDNCNLPDCRSFLQRF
jgi:hypothetical protein